MKKTLFLSAILGAALCSSAFGTVEITVGENETRDISTDITTSDVSLTLSNGATVTNKSKNYAAGSSWDKQISSVTLDSGATATLDVSGTANSTGVGLVSSGLGEVAVNLNGGTLVKTGTGQTIVYHVTTGDSAGTIQVDNGRLLFDGTGYAFHGTNANLVVNANGSLNFNNLESTMKALTTSGTVIVNSGSTYVNGTFTANTGSNTTINNAKTLTVKGLNTTGGIIQGAGTLFVDAGKTANNTTLDFDYISTDTKLSLKQAHGTLKAAGTAIANAITLTNGDWAAAEWVNVEGSSYTFSGAISGGGNQVFSGKSGRKEVALTFNGNLSGWNSNGDGYKGLRAASGMTLNVTIGGSLTGDAAKVANAFNADSDSKLNLTIDRDATLNGNLRITSLTINGSKAVDLNMNVLTLSTMTLGNGSTVNFHSTEDWTKSEVARTTGNGYGHVGISKTLGYTVTDNGATVTVDGLAATLNGSELSCTTTEETHTYYINDLASAAMVTGTATLNAGTYALNGALVVGENSATAEGSSLTLNGTTSVSVGGDNYIEVYHNSTLTLEDSASLAATAEDSRRSLWLHNGSTVSMADNASITLRGLKLQGGEITATGDTQIGGGSYNAAKTTISGTAITVSGASLAAHNVQGGSVTVDSGTTTDINSALSDTTDLTVNSGSTANFTQTDSSVKTLAGEGSVTVGEGAGLTVHGDSSVNTLGGLGTVTALADLTVTGGNVTLGGLEIAGGKTVTIGSKESHNHTLALQSLTVNSAAESPTTLNANLDLRDTTTLTLNGALTLGCELNLGDGGIELGGTLLEQALELTEVGDSVTLFNSVDRVTGYKSPWEASTIFSNDALKATDTKNYLVVFNSTDKTVNLTLVPEPATATLSLLALAALAARRRRR